MPDARPRVLVEDDPTVSEVVARYLARDSYAVGTADDGAVGLEGAIADPPDLVVLDLMLPSMGALEVCRRSRVGASPARPRQVATVWGIGYRFEP